MKELNLIVKHVKGDSQVEHFVTKGTFQLTTRGGKHRVGTRGPCLEIGRRNHTCLKCHDPFRTRVNTASITKLVLPGKNNHR